VSLVLVVARPPRPAELGIALPALRSLATPAGPGAEGRAARDAVAAGAGARTDVWRAVRDEVVHLRGVASGAVTPGRLDVLAGAIAEDGGDPSVVYAATPDAAIAAVRRRIDEGAAAVAVLPIAVAVDRGVVPLLDPRLVELHRRLEEVGRHHPGVEIQYLGPPFDDAPALEAAIAALRPAGSEEPALLAGAIERAFDGDLERFGRFMGALQDGVPSGTRLVLRGSAVQGASYRTGEPFDSRGPRTSDLDIVLLGDAAMEAWAPEAFYLPGVNSQPLWDDAPDVAAPDLERARRSAQSIAGRPVSLQAMARWFLDLRSGLQGTPYVLLGG
jgi:hypothetical protein